MRSGARMFVVLACALAGGLAVMAIAGQSWEVQASRVDVGAGMCVSLPTFLEEQIFFDDFESDKGWVTDPFGDDTATRGMWERANPEGAQYNATSYQLDDTVSGYLDLVTGPLAGSSVGSYDIDGGKTSIRSPDITLPSGGDLTLSLSYYLAH